MNCYAFQYLGHFLTPNSSRFFIKETTCETTNNVNGLRYNSGYKQIRANFPLYSAISVNDDPFCPNRPLWNRPFMSWRPSSTPSTTLPVTHLPRKLLGALTSLMRPSPTPYGLHPLHTAFTHSLQPSLTPYDLHSLHTAFTHFIHPSLTPYGLQPLHMAFTHSIRPSLTPYGLHLLHTAFTHSIRPSLTPYGLCPLHTAFRSSPQPLL